MDKTHPDTIDKRVFTCKGCGYSAPVYGEMYFDQGCFNYMATFECKECGVLFEGLISQIHMDQTNFEMEYNLAEAFTCLRCGNNSANVWNKDTGGCPKCSAKMSFNVDGVIKLKWEV